MNRVTGRNFSVDYMEKGPGVWIAESILKDEYHEIKASVEVDMENFIITSASFSFEKYPLTPCTAFEKTAEKLIGLKIDNNFSRNAAGLMLGPHGCPNILMLLNISLPGILYYYYPYQVSQRRMSEDEWQNMIHGELKNACIGHTLL